MIPKLGVLANVNDFQLLSLNYFCLRKVDEQSGGMPAAFLLCYKESLQIKFISINILPGMKMI